MVQLGTRYHEVYNKVNKCYAVTKTKTKCKPIEFLLHNNLVKMLTNISSLYYTLFSHQHSFDVSFEQLRSIARFFNTMH